MKLIHGMAEVSDNISSGDLCSVSKYIKYGVGVIAGYNVGWQECW